MGTETATILVVDLVGSTELRAAIGEDAAEDLRRRFDRLVADVVAENGGTLVKGLGDGALATFAGAAAAVAAAVGLQQGVEVMARRERQDLAVRVGLSAGDVTVEDGDTFGVPVVEASRLCGAAASGQILASDIVRVLARGRGGHELASVGALDLKGLPDPVEAVAVAWEPLATTTDLRSRSPYVGRAPERALLAERLRAAAGGQGGLVLVAGEPGIGKTRFVTEACAAAYGGDEPLLVLSGGCHDGEEAAYAPFVEAFAEWGRRTPSAAVDRALGPEGPVLGRIVPALRSVLPELAEPADIAPAEATARAHDAVTQVLGRLAEEATVVLVLDDLHWADHATVGLLRAVARRARRGRLLVVGTYRDTDLDRRHPLAEALPLLRREVEPTRIALDGLTLDDVHALLEEVAGQEVPVAFAELLARQTDGNPFFLRELLLHLGDSGALRYEDGAWVAADDLADVIPEGIREVLGRRLSQLSGAANQLLTVGALFDAGFPLAVAAEVAGLGEDEALDAVDEALEARVVAPTEAFDEYAFTHALFRQTLVAELNPSRQVRLHRSLAEGLEKVLASEPTTEQAASLARHWHRSAALPGGDRGVPYAVAAAEGAAARYAHAEARDLYGIALELLSAGDEREEAVRRAHFESAVLARSPAAGLLAEAEELGEWLAGHVGADAAADQLAGAFSLDIGGLPAESQWALAAIGRRWLDPARRDLTWLILRLAELDEADFHDPDQPGIPFDSPARRELTAVFESLPSGVRRSVFLMPSSRAVAEEMLREPVVDDDIGWQALWAAGHQRELAERFRASIERWRAEGGLTGVGLALALLVRVETLLGRYDEAARWLAESHAWLERLPPREQRGVPDPRRRRAGLPGAGRGGRGHGHVVRRPSRHPVGGARHHRLERAHPRPGRAGRGGAGRPRTGDRGDRAGPGLGHQLPDDGLRRRRGAVVARAHRPPRRHRGQPPGQGARARPPLRRGRRPVGHGVAGLPAGRPRRGPRLVRRGPTGAGRGGGGGAAARGRPRRGAPGAAPRRRRGPGAIRGVRGVGPGRVHPPRDGGVARPPRRAGGARRPNLVRARPPPWQGGA